MGALFSLQYGQLLFAHHTRDEKPRPEEHTLHVHDMHELYVFLAGRGRYAVEGRIYELTPGSVMVMRAGESHHLHISGETPYERMAIHLSREALRRVDPDDRLAPLLRDRPLGQRNHYHYDELAGTPVRPALESLAALMRADEDRERRTWMLLTYAAPVLFELQQRLERPVQGGSPPADVVGRVVRYINENLDRDLSLDALSGRFFISRSHLNDRFRKQTGVTVGEYVRVKRLTLARQLIRGGAAAADACAACGFGEYSSFFRQYKARFGLSPSADKKRE